MFCGKKRIKRFRYRVLNTKNIHRDFCSEDCLIINQLKNKKKMEKEFKEELQKEEEKIYKKLSSYVKSVSLREQRRFFKLLNEYIDVQIELEKYCNQQEK